jgi:hemoglobin-like flavoprotein
MEAQGAKLMATIGVAVDSLDRLHEVVPKLRALGRQHAALGVQDAHDATVAEALLWTLGQGLGTDFTDRAREAWTACYAALSGEMKAAAAGP